MKNFFLSYQRLRKKEQPARMKPLEEGLDFYMENGNMVFTEAYHLARGYCCQSGCRHCPYPKESGRKQSSS